MNIALSLKSYNLSATLSGERLFVDWDNLDQDNIQEANEGGGG